MKLTIPIDVLLADAMNELELIPYMLKLRLREHGVPVLIEPSLVRSDSITVLHGSITLTVNSDTIEIEYNE